LQRVPESVETASTDVLKEGELITDILEGVVLFATVVSEGSGKRRLTFAKCIIGAQLSDKIVGNKTDD
jgi:hypothetical protein